MYPIAQRLHVNIQRALSDLLLCPRNKQYAVAIARQVLAKQTKKEAVREVIINEDMMLRLKYAASISVSGIKEIRHYLKHHAAPIHRAIQFRNSLYETKCEPITWSVEGTPNTKVDGPKYAQRLLNVSFWREQADFTGKLGPCNVDGIAYAGIPLTLT